MSLIFTKRFKKAYKQLPRPAQSKVKKALRLLDENPRYPSLRIKRIQGTDRLYEGRIDQKYRFSFEFDGEDILLRNVDNHGPIVRTEPPWRIRPFLPTDQAAAKQLILNGLAEHWGVLDLRLNPDLDDIQANYPDSGGAFVVVAAGGQLIGTGGLRPETAVAVRIVRVSVAQAYRRQGIGRALTAQLLAIAYQAGYAKVLVETTASWEPALRLYQDFGFAEVTRCGGNVHFELAIKK